MARFADKVAMVTGAAQGIGRAVAEKLIDEGARVLLLDDEASYITGQALILDGGLTLGLKLPMPGERRQQPRR